MPTIAMSDPRYYKYFAFISYSRKDEAFAKRLQHFLTGFKLPTRLCKQYPDKPQSLRPIYRDKTDLGVDKLNQGLTHGLSLSKYLIVICSENSARPNRDGKNWIDEEVRTFLSLEEGNTDHVIPVLLRQKGQRTADCTPPAVKELGLLAADVLDKGENRVFSDVAAKMLGLEPDELWNWWERAQRRKRRILQTLGGLAAALAACAGWVTWDYCAPHYTYFADYVECNNIPQGIHPLTEEETKHMHSHYRFTTRYHRLMSVETLNSTGNPRDTSALPGRNERPVSIHFNYDKETGEVTTHTYYNAVGKVVQTRSVGAKSIYFRSVTKEDGKTVDLGAGNAALVLSPFKDRDNIRNKNVKRIVVERDAHGFITTERFSEDGHNAFICNEEGAWGRRYRRDAQGRPLEITNIDKNGNSLAARSGVASTRYTYHPATGQVESVSYHDAQGNLVYCKDGYAIEKYTYDTQGNIISEACFDTEGKPCTVKDGYASMKLTYDAQGNMTSQAFFDADEKPCTVKDGYASWKAAYDAQGNTTSEAYFDAKGKPCTHKDGFASRKAAYDAQGNQTSVAYFDAEGKPCMNKDGYASGKATYDAQGNTTSVAYFDTEGKPCTNKDGLASWKATYDAQGNRTSQAYFDTEGTPFTHKHGYASWTAAYDAQGNRTSVAFFDTEGRPCMNRNGYASMQTTFDAAGNVTSIIYYDAEGKVIATRTTDED